jgi:hypothetical protein
MVYPPATSAAGARPLEGLRSLQINSWLGPISFDKAFTLSDHTMQTKFQSQWPSDVESPVPSFWAQKWSNIGTVSTWMGDRLMGLCSSYFQGNCWTAVGFWCCITSWGIDPICEGTPPKGVPTGWSWSYDLWSGHQQNKTKQEAVTIEVS